MAHVRRGGAGNERRTRAVRARDKSRKLNKHYVGEFHVHRVADDRAVRLSVSRVRNELHVPHAKIVSAVGPLLEHGDRRPGTRTAAGIIITTSSITPVGRACDGFRSDHFETPPVGLYSGGVCGSAAKDEQR